jgi:hypothetical protein
LTGMLTRPKLMAPFHIGLGGNLSSSNGRGEQDFSSLLG